MIGRCELCGKESKLLKTKIESTVLSTCEDCSNFGEVLEEIMEKQPTPTFKKPTKPQKEEPIEFIVEDYSEKIKKAREKRNMKQEELAKKLAIKESIVHKLESGRIEPSTDLARKLERFLHIKLVKEYVDDYEKKTSSPSSLTIGDLLTKK